jgi:hypothetical protein
MTKKLPGRSIASTEPGDVSFDCGSNVAKRKTEIAVPQARPRVPQARPFLNNHRSNSAADTSVRDAAIAFSFAILHGADPEAIRLSLSRDSNGRASGVLGAALDHIAGEAP